MGTHYLLLARQARRLTRLTTADDVRQAASATTSVRELDAIVTECRACPRLVAWREQVADQKRRSFIDESYWGRPVPGFGDPKATILIVGLAPAAHGGNRTGRIFTGDRSGDWLYAALHRAGMANQPTSVSANDGLMLSGVRVTAAVRCAPQENKPTTDERDTCASWLHADLRLTPARVLIALGSFAWAATLTAAARAGAVVPRPRPRFGHGTEAVVGDWHLIGSYHPSQQNTFTGKLTEQMLDAVLARAKELSGRHA
jgi:uracil-DNA glycosylase family 4